jgi:hypothetical protein
MAETAEQKKERMRVYRAANLEKRAKYNREYAAKNREKHLAWRREWHRKNGDKVRAYQNKRYAEKKDEINPKKNARRRERYLTDINFKLRCRVRNSSTRVLEFTGTKKDFKSMEIVGCSIDFLRLHIESQFKPGMTWENHGPFGWHIDHIRPLCSFDLTKPEELAAALHYTNLQPLWAQDNQRKGGRFELVA